MDGNTPVLELEGVSKSFGPVQALSEVDFKVHNGEVVALVGDNGAGKSTLVKAIAGIHPVDEGRIVFEGNEVRIAGPTDATDLGIATVYQDLALCDNLDVVENLFLGREEGGFALDETSMEKQTGELLGRLAVTIVDIRSEVGTLSGGQRGGGGRDPGGRFGPLRQTGGGGEMGARGGVPPAGTADAEVAPPRADLL